jgi:hypothetical protein
VEVQQYSLGLLITFTFKCETLKSISTSAMDGYAPTRYIEQLLCVKINFKIKITETNWKVVDWTVTEHLLSLFTQLIRFALTCR